jgi:hypothetical protein
MILAMIDLLCSMILILAVFRSMSLGAPFSALFFTALSGAALLASGIVLAVKS